MAYAHLTGDERYTIYEQLGTGFPQTEIASALGRHKSTISCEIRRNRGLRGYRPQQAQVFAPGRRVMARGGRRITATTWSICQTLIASGHSPEQAAGRCERQGGGRVSHEFLYRRVYADQAAGGGLWRHLRCQKKRRKRYGWGRQLRGRIVGRVGIELRCPRVEARSVVGHWDGDTVVGKNHRGLLVTLAERRSGFSLTRRVATKGADEVFYAVVDMLAPYRRMVRTLTFDNGLERLS